MAVNTEMSIPYEKRGINQMNTRTSLLVGGKQRKTRSGSKETFTILSSSNRKRSFLKVLVPNRDPVGDLYRLFPQLPPGEKPYNGYTCALHKDILLQGRLIICTNCICFHSNIFGYETRLIINFKNILAIRREKTAFVVPNAISIRTLHKRYLFCSFLSRESVFKLLSRVRKLSTEQHETKSFDYHGNKTEGNLKGKEMETTDYNQNKLFFTSSLSYESSMGAGFAHDLPERPHTSPPSLNYSPTYLVSLNSHRKTEGLDELSDTDTEIPDNLDDNVFTFKENIGFSGKLTKSNTLGDLRELKSFTDRIGTKAVIKIGKMMSARQKRSDLIARACCPMIESGSILTANMKAVSTTLFQLLYKVPAKHPTLLFISFLIAILAFISVGLLVRVHSVTNSFQSHLKEADIAAITLNEIKFKHLFQERDAVHTAKVERMRAMLSLNLQTMTEVQEALRKLREKLPT